MGTSHGRAARIVHSRDRQTSLESRGVVTRPGRAACSSRRRGPLDGRPYSSMHLLPQRDGVEDLALGAPEAVLGAVDRALDSRGP